MDFREDPLASVIEEIAALLATGYLRLRKARTLSESAAPAQRSKQPENHLIARRARALMVLQAYRRDEKGD